MFELPPDTPSPSNTRSLLRLNHIILKRKKNMDYLGRINEKEKRDRSNSTMGFYRNKIGPLLATPVAIGLVHRIGP